MLGQRNDFQTSQIELNTCIPQLAALYKTLTGRSTIQTTSNSWELLNNGQVCQNIFSFCFVMLDQKAFTQKPLSILWTFHITHTEFHTNKEVHTHAKHYIKQLHHTFCAMVGTHNWSTKYLVILLQSRERERREKIQLGWLPGALHKNWRHRKTLHTFCEWFLGWVLELNFIATYRVGCVFVAYNKC